MALNFYTYTPNCTGTNQEKCGQFAIEYMYDRLRIYLSATYQGVSAKTDSPKSASDALTAGWIPQWVYDVYNPTWRARPIWNTLSFTVSGVEYYILDVFHNAVPVMNNIFVARKIGNSTCLGYLFSYSSSNAGSYQQYLENTETLTTVLKYENGNFYIKPLITSGVSDGMYYGCGTLKVVPVNAADTNCFVSFMSYSGDNIMFNSAFSSEPLTNITYMTAENFKLEASGFGVNKYNNKVPLYRVWCGTATGGIRGYVQDLRVLPNNYNSGNGTFTIDGVDYYGIGSNPCINNSGGSADAANVIMKV